MRVLVDITHPAQVHFFKNLIRLLRRDGHPVLVTAREKDVTTRLLTALGIEHHCISRMGKGLRGLGRELLARDLRLWLLARRFRPDVMVARVGISIGLVGRILNVPRVIFEDTEHAKLQLALSLPFATRICTGGGYLNDLGPRQVRFRGVPVLAYMAPEYFTPDPAPLRAAGVEPDQPYIVLRVVSWGAAHDVGHHGLTDTHLAEMIDRLRPFGRVYVSSERPLPMALREFQSPVPADRMHDLLAFASLFLGEGGTMAAEAAVLGTPAIFCSPLRVGFLLALEHEHDLARNCDTFDEGLVLAEEILASPDHAEQWQHKRQRMLDQADDVTEFMLDQVQAAARNRRR